MSEKRQEEEESTCFDGKRPRKPPSFRSVVLDVMILRKLQQLAEPILEPLIRRVVKEEVDSALRRHSVNKKRNNLKSVHHSESRCLHFLNAMSLPVFTGTRVEGEGGNSLAVALLDTSTGEVVSSDLESSGKVEIVVLEGDFDSDEGYNWSAEDFTSNIVREREGKKPILTGDDVIVSLKDGVAAMSDIFFTDNSSWTRSRKFRLGARVVQSEGGGRVKEAKSESFVVRDHRGELYKKHHPPSLCDEVWRLKKIGKDGAFHQRLRKERINTVRDFLVSFYLDTPKLRNIFGTGMPAKMWDVMVEHAQTCVLDNKLYLYTCLQKRVVFNVVGQLIGTLIDGQYASADKLSEPEKADAQALVITAFKDWANVATIDDQSLLINGLSSSSPILRFEPSGHDPQDFVLENANTNDNVGANSYSPQFLPAPDLMQSVYSVGGLSSNSIDYLHDHMNGGGMRTLDQGSCGSNQDVNAMTQPLISGNMDDYTPQTPNFDMSTELYNAIRAFLPSSSVAVDQVSRRWSILLSVLRWRSSMRRIMARKIHNKEDEDAS